MSFSLLQNLIITQLPNFELKRQIYLQQQCSSNISFDSFLILISNIAISFHFFSIDERWFYIGLGFSAFHLMIFFISFNNIQNLVYSTLKNLKFLYFFSDLLLIALICLHQSVEKFPLAISFIIRYILVQNSTIITLISQQTEILIFLILILIFNFLNIYTSALSEEYEKFIYWGLDVLQYLMMIAAIKPNLSINNSTQYKNEDDQKVNINYIEQINTSRRETLFVLEKLPFPYCQFDNTSIEILKQNQQFEDITGVRDSQSLISLLKDFKVKVKHKKASPTINNKQTLDSINRKTLLEQNLIETDREGIIKWLEKLKTKEEPNKINEHDSGKIMSEQMIIISNLDINLEASIFFNTDSSILFIRKICSCKINQIIKNRLFSFCPISNRISQPRISVENNNKLEKVNQENPQFQFIQTLQEDQNEIDQNSSDRKKCNTQQEEILRSNKRKSKSQINTRKQSASIESLSFKFFKNNTQDLSSGLSCLVCLIDSAILDKNFLKYHQDRYIYPAQHSLTNLKFSLNQLRDYFDLSYKDGFTFKYEKFLLSEMITEIQVVFESMSEMKNLQFDIEIAQDVPQLFISDRNRVLDIIFLLLRNSIKYTFSGRIQLQIRVFSSLLLKTPKLISTTPKNNNNNNNNNGNYFNNSNQNFSNNSNQFGEKKWIEFIVKDTGIGLDQFKLMKLQNHINDSKNTNISVDAHQKEQGYTGFNFKLASMIAEKLSGEIKRGLEFDSELNQGTTISFVVENIVYKEFKERSVSLHTNNKQDSRSMDFNVFKQSDKSNKSIAMTIDGDQYFNNNNYSNNEGGRERGYSQETKQVSPLISGLGHNDHGWRKNEGNYSGKDLDLSQKPLMQSSFINWNVGYAGNESIYINSKHKNNIDFLELDEKTPSNAIISTNMNIKQNNIEYNEYQQSQMKKKIKKISKEQKRNLINSDTIGNQFKYREDDEDFEEDNCDYANTLIKSEFTPKVVFNLDHSQYISNTKQIITNTLQQPNGSQKLTKKESEDLENYSYSIEQAKDNKMKLNVVKEMNIKFMPENSQQIASNNNDQLNRISNNSSNKSSSNNSNIKNSSHINITNSIYQNNTNFNQNQPNNKSIRKLSLEDQNIQNPNAYSQICKAASLESEHDLPTSSSQKYIIYSDACIIREIPAYSLTCCSKMLIIDNQPLNCLAISSLAHQFKIDCEITFNGEQGMTIVQTRAQKPCQTCSLNYFPFIIVEMNMPVLDGYEFIRKFRDFEVIHQKILKAKSNIIACSGFSGYEDQKRAYDRGCNVFLNQPMSHSDFQPIFKEINFNS